MLLIIDADVLIDYTQADPTVLSLVAAHLGRVYVAAATLDEVTGLDEEQCERLGLEVIEGETEQLIEAGQRRSGLSFADHLCLILAYDNGWTCVTNDKGLRSQCEEDAMTH